MTSSKNQKPGILLPPAVGYSLKIQYRFYRTNKITF